MDSTFSSAVQDSIFNTPINLVFILDEQQTTITRTAYTIFNALSAVGGMISIVVGVLSVLIRNLQENMFYTSIIKKMYIY